jgi:hypothetical protein
MGLRPVFSWHKLLLGNVMVKTKQEVNQIRKATKRQLRLYNKGRHDRLTSLIGRGRSDSQGFAEWMLEGFRNLLRKSRTSAIPKQDSYCGGMRLELFVALGIAEGSELDNIRSTQR